MADIPIQSEIYNEQSEENINEVETLLRDHNLLDADANIVATDDPAENNRIAILNGCLQGADITAAKHI